MQRRDASIDEAALTLEVASEAELAPLAGLLVNVLPARVFVGLWGDLGAGKTAFVKAVAAAAGIDPSEVVSPTFGLIHVHAGPQGRFVHADMYRLPHEADLRETGWEDAVAEPGWVFLEWPERISAALPEDRLDVEIVVTSVDGRTIHLRGRGPRHAAVVAALAGRIAKPAI
jgi:tRNA threonylcarbamoyladenosine biosynthesis protein TsaE